MNARTKYLIVLTRSDHNTRENEPDIFEEFLALDKVEESGDKYQVYCQTPPV